LFFIFFGCLFICCSDGNQFNSNDVGNDFSISIGDSVIVKIFLNSDNELLDGIIFLKLDKGLKQMKRYDYAFDKKGFISSSETPISNEREIFIRYENGFPKYSAELKDSIFSGEVRDYDTKVTKVSLQENGVKYYEVDSSGLIHARPRIWNIQKISNDSAIYKMSHDKDRFSRVDFHPKAYRLIILDNRNKDNFQFTKIRLSDTSKVQSYGIRLKPFKGSKEVIVMGNFFTDSLTENDSFWRSYNLILDTLDLSEG